jgi:signal transduction histidine kinase
MKSHLSERIVERERIARELHDTLLQGFQGLVLKFQTATSKIPESEPARAMMENALDRADEVLVEGRNRVRDLRSEGVSENDLSEALRVVGEELKLDHPVAFTLNVKGFPRRLHPIVRDEAYWIGREALFNAFVHASATSVECELTYHRRYFILGIRDNGKGIDTQILQLGREGDWGLSGMRERSKKIMASFEIWSRNEAGTEIELKVPARMAYLEKSATARWPMFLRGMWNRGNHDGN